MEALEVKHTPGPWFVGAQNDELYIIDKRPGFNDHPFHERDVNPIAKVYGQNQANANLFSAAPEMLEALKAAGEYLTVKTTKGYPEEGVIELYRQVVKSIAKAEGRA